MSTFLVSFGVVAVTIAAVLHVVLNGPDQPATVRQQSPGGKSRRTRRAEARSRRRGEAEEMRTPSAARPAMATPATAGFALPDSDIMRLRVLPAARTTPSVRIRSGVVLVLLVAVLGALLALAVGGLVLGVALLVRGATG